MTSFDTVRCEATFVLRADYTQLSRRFNIRLPIKYTVTIALSIVVFAVVLGVAVGYVAGLWAKSAGTLKMDLGGISLAFDPAEALGAACFAAVCFCGVYLIYSEMLPNRTRDLLHAADSNSVRHYRISILAVAIARRLATLCIKTAVPMSVVFGVGVARGNLSLVLLAVTVVAMSPIFAVAIYRTISRVTITRFFIHAPISLMLWVGLGAGTAIFLRSVDAFRIESIQRVISGFRYINTYLQPLSASAVCFTAVSVPAAVSWSRSHKKRGIKRASRGKNLDGVGSAERSRYEAWRDLRWLVCILINKSDQGGIAAARTAFYFLQAAGYSLLAFGVVLSGAIAPILQRNGNAALFSLLSLLGIVVSAPLLASVGFRTRMSELRWMVRNGVDARQLSVFWFLTSLGTMYVVVLPLTLSIGVIYWNLGTMFFCAISPATCFCALHIGSVLDRQPYRRPDGVVDEGVGGSIMGSGLALLALSSIFLPVTVGVPVLLVVTIGCSVLCLHLVANEIEAK